MQYYSGQGNSVTPMKQNLWANSEYIEIEFRVSITTKQQQWNPWKSHIDQHKVLCICSKLYIILMNTMPQILWQKDVGHGSAIMSCQYQNMTQLTVDAAHLMNIHVCKHDGLEMHMAIDWFSYIGSTMLLLILLCVWMYMCWNKKTEFTGTQLLCIVVCMD